MSQWKSQLDRISKQHTWTDAQHKYIWKKLTEEADFGFTSMIPSYLDALETLPGAKVKSCFGAQTQSARTLFDILDEALADEQPILVPPIFEVPTDQLLSDLEIDKNEVLTKDVKCSKCHKSDSIRFEGSVQQRSADEPETKYYYCQRCDKRIRVS